MPACVVTQHQMRDTRLVMIYLVMSNCLKIFPKYLLCLPAMNVLQHLKCWVSKPNKLGLN